jgi:hypothetical protein
MDSKGIPEFSLIAPDSSSVEVEFRRQFPSLAGMRDLAGFVYDLMNSTALVADLSERYGIGREFATELEQFRSRH